jgi:hypothetical protein
LTQINRAMKPAFYLLLSIVLLVSVVWGCQSPTEEPVVPIVTPPSSTTTPPAATTVVSDLYNPIRPTDFVPDSSATAYANVPQPPANYRIKRIVFKQWDTPELVVGREQIQVGNLSLSAATGFVEDLFYDQQGRLIKERKLDHRNRIDSVIYEYSPGKVVINHHLFEGVYNNVVTYRDYTIDVPLDGRGVATSRYKINDLEYDTNDILIRIGAVYSVSVVAGNVVSDISRNPDGGFGNQTDRHIYYLNRPNLPNLKPFYGNESRNLPAGFIRSIYNSTYYGTGDAYRIRYIYSITEDWLNVG